MLVAFTGPQSSGKSTLIEAIKDKFPDFEYKPSATRSIKAKGFTINNIGDNFDDTQKEVINSHIDNIKYYLEHKGNVILDRCILDGIVYTTYFYRKGKVSESVMDYGNKAIEKYYNVYNTVFYLDPSGVPLADDNVRSTDIIFRKDIIYIFNEYLEKYPATILSGSIDERVNKVLSTLK